MSNHQYSYPGAGINTLLLTLLALCACFAFTGARADDQDEKELQHALRSALLPNPAALKPFRINNQDNQPFGLGELQGKWTFMFFGYTSCPDVCPMTADELNIVAKELAAEPDYRLNTRFVFVSVDPYRDTPETLKKFTEYFAFGLQGAVAPVEALKELTDQLGVFHRRMIVQDRETQQREYAVEHDSEIYLIDPEAKPVAKFSQPHYGKEIAQLYVRIRQMARQPAVLVNPGG